MKACQTVSDRGEAVLGPADFYTRQDAIAARDIARQTVAAVKPLLPNEA